MLVNLHLLLAVKTFRVESEDRFPTHQPTYMEIQVDTLDQTTEHHRETATAATFVAAKLTTDIEEKKDKKENDQQTRNRLLTERHSAFDHELDARQDRIAQATAAQDTTHIWKLMMAAMEIPSPP